MKLSLDRIKSMDWKQFGVNHGEKVALLSVGLVVVLILFLGTRWKTFDEKKPEDLTKGVAEQSAILEAATWPESEQAIYTDRYDVNTVYDNTYSVVEASPFKYPPGHPMIWPLHRRQEPIEEPTWLPVEDLLATPGRFIMELPPPGEEPLTDGALALDEEPGTQAPMTREEALLQALKAKNNRPNGEGGFPMDPGFEGAPGAPGLPGNEFPEGMGPDGMPLEGMEGMGEMGPQINARGVRYTAVTGVFPFRKQAEMVFKARHDPTLNNPWEWVNIVNFEIQRQTAKPGPNPWSDKEADWTTLDKSVALDLLAEAVDYAEDIVDYSNTNFVITSPLPYRLVGEWHPYFVGHPKIKTMTERQIELRRMLNEELVRLQKEASTADENGIGGFAFAQRDMYGLQNEVASDASQKRQLLQNLKKSMNPENAEGFQMPTADLESMLTATAQTPEYLLFRYLDFDVEPGKSYRYRVRLKLKNPNFNELADNLAAENVGMGEFRDSPWSNPTPVAIVSDDSRYYVEEVVPPRGRRDPVAKIDLYQWLNEIGTTAHKMVEVQVGQIVGQPKPQVDEKKAAQPDSRFVEVLRPYVSFKAEPIELTTRDAVVDLVAGPSRVPTNFHQELGLELKPISQVLVVNEFGELENRNPISQSKQRQMTQRLLEAEYEGWEYLKTLGQQPQGEGDMVDGMMEGDLSDLANYGRGGRGGGGRGGRGGAAAGRGGAADHGAGRGGGANPLRRNRGRGMGMGGV